MKKTKSAAYDRIITRKPVSFWPKPILMDCLVSLYIAQCGAYKHAQHFIYRCSFMLRHHIACRSQTNTHTHITNVEKTSIAQFMKSTVHTCMSVLSHSLAIFVFFFIYFGSLSLSLEPRSVGWHAAAVWPAPVSTSTAIPVSYHHRRMLSPCVCVCCLPCVCAIEFICKTRKYFKSNYTHFSQTSSGGTCTQKRQQARAKTNTHTTEVKERQNKRKIRSHTNIEIQTVAAAIECCCVFSKKKFQLDRIVCLNCLVGHFFAVFGCPILYVCVCECVKRVCPRVIDVFRDRQKSIIHTKAFAAAAVLIDFFTFHFSRKFRRRRSVRIGILQRASNSE